MLQQQLEQAQERELQAKNDQLTVKNEKINKELKIQLNLIFSILTSIFIPPTKVLINVSALGASLEIK
jgi:hypothetical protein